MKPSMRAVLGFVALTLAVGTLAVAQPGANLPSASAAIRQSGTTTLTPQIVQNGATVARADRALLVGKVRFRPVRPRRPVVIQRRVGKEPWAAVTTLRQNRRGTVSFVARARARGGAPFTYRGVAQPWKGLARYASTRQSAGIWKLRFSDEFNGTSLDFDKWSHRHVGTYYPTWNRACSASYPEAVEVGGGRVALWVMADTERQESVGECVDDLRPSSTNRTWYKNGHISTESVANGRFLYGVAAARVKFDRHRGAHGAFWLQTTVRDIPDAGPEMDGAEVDIAEYFGTNFYEGDVYSFVHYKDASGATHKVPAQVANPAARLALAARDDWFKRYHVFSVEWTPDAYVFRIDGIQTMRITEGVSQVPEFLLLSMLSSGWELESMKPETLPNATEVDWVRFWQK